MRRLVASSRECARLIANLPTSWLCYLWSDQVFVGALLRVGRESTTSGVANLAPAPHSHNCIALFFLGFGCSVNRTYINWCATVRMACDDDRVTGKQHTRKEKKHEEDRSEWNGQAMKRNEEERRRKQRRNSTCLNKHTWALRRLAHTTIIQDRPVLGSSIHAIQSHFMFFFPFTFFLCLLMVVCVVAFDLMCFNSCALRTEFIKISVLVRRGYVFWRFRMNSAGRMIVTATCVAVVKRG